MNILLVDDEPFVRASMARLIANVEPNHAVREAEDGEEALLALETERCDLVITDIRMPAVNGLELAKRVRERWPDIDVVMLTGHADFEYAQEAIRYHVTEYLLKPVSLDHMRRVIAQAEARLRDRRAAEAVGKLRTKSLLEKRVHDLCYELPLPYYDESLFPPFDRFALYAFSVTADGGRERTARFAAKNVAEEALAAYGFPIVVPTDRAVVAALFLPRGAEPPSDDTLRALAAVVAETAKRVARLDVAGAFGGASAQLRDMQELYRSALGQLGAPQEAEPAASAPEVHRIVRAALDLVQERYAEDLTLTSLAEALYVSPNYLSGLFKSETGETFTHHLTKARMAQAKKLLRETNLKIYTICEQVGYTDQAHFSRMFKTLEGMTPYEYRSKTTI